MAKAVRTLAIGDIHGCRRSLEALADLVGFAPGDTIVALGDYVDRGPDSKGVIDFLIALASTCELVHLRGNHEIMMEKARESLAEMRGWLGVGGEATLDSYGTQSIHAVPQTHWDFIASGARYHESDTHFFVHANAFPNLPLADQPDSMLYWERFVSPSPHQSGKIMVCGHSPQRSGLPKNIGHAICIDTWAYGDGWLTCLDTTSGHFWQTNERGEHRSDEIANLPE